MIIPTNKQSSKSHPPATIKTSAIKPLPDFRRPQRSPKVPRITKGPRSSQIFGDFPIPKAPSCSTDVAQAADDRFKLLLGIWLGLNFTRRSKHEFWSGQKQAVSHWSIILSFYLSIYARFIICISIYIYILICIYIVICVQLQMLLDKRSEECVGTMIWAFGRMGWQECAFSQRLIGCIPHLDCSLAQSIPTWMCIPHSI